MSLTCKNCGEPLEPDWDECPVCETPVERKLVCSNCGKELKNNWKKCPYCKTPTPYGLQNPSQTLSGITSPLSGSSISNTAPSGYNPLGATETVSPWSMGMPGAGEISQSAYPTAQPQQAPELQPGDEIAGQFKIKRKIGDGGFAKVYLAEHLTLGEDIALKAIPTFGNVEKIISVLAGEYKSQLKIENRKHIIRSEAPVKCSHAGMDWVLLPMELGEKTLRDWLRETRGDIEGRIEEGIKLFKQACKGVEAIHEAGLLHLDLKPENILLLKEDGGKAGNWQVKVADFGLARGLDKLAEVRPELLHDGIGTPAYMAPEQIVSAHWKNIDQRADIYALGMILFEILDGDLPYSGSPAEIRAKKLNPAIKIRKPRGEKLKVALTLKMLEEEGNRPSSASEILRMLNTNPQEEFEFRRAEEANHISAWKNFISKWKEGYFVEEARIKLKELENLQLEDYLKAKDEQTIEAWEKFIKRWNHGSNLLDEAKNELKKLKQKIKNEEEEKSKRKENLDFFDTLMRKARSVYYRAAKLGVTLDKFENEIGQFEFLFSQKNSLKQEEEILSDFEREIVLALSQVRRAENNRNRI